MTRTHLGFIAQLEPTNAVSPISWQVVDLVVAVFAATKPHRKSNFQERCFRLRPRKQQTQNKEIHEKAVQYTDTDQSWQR
ncbi:MAG: hypothetical protein ACR2LR_05905 [Hassallia sp.]